MHTQTVPSNRTVVKYDPAAHQWLVINGRTWRFPAEPQGMLEAQLLALQYDCPAVATDVRVIIARYEEHPQVEAIISRVVKAGFLANDGHVTILDVATNGHPTFVKVAVKSQSGDRQYRVLHNLTWCCDCQDWENGRARRMGYQRETGAPHIADKGTACKHVFAVSLALTQLRRGTESIAEERKECAEAIERMVNVRVWQSLHY